MLDPADNTTCHASLRWTLTALLALNGLSSGLAGADDVGAPVWPEPAANLRVYSVRPRLFDYLFLGASSGTGSNAAPLLYFRDMAGNTVAASPGAMVGAYAVVSFTPGRARLFNASVNAALDTDISTVALRDATGSNHVLTVGRQLVESGWMSCLVSLASGGWGYVRDGDTRKIEGLDLTVLRVGPTATVIRSESRAVAIPPISSAERNHLLALWESQRRAAEEQRVQALALAQSEDTARRRQAANDAVIAAAALIVPSQTEIVPSTAYSFGYEGPVWIDFPAVPYYSVGNWPNVPPWFHHFHGHEWH